MRGAGSQGEVTLHSCTVPEAQAAPADRCAHSGGLNTKQKAATLQTWGRVCHVKCKIQGDKGPAQVPKVDCKITRERKSQGVHNERGLCSQLN